MGRGGGVVMEEEAGGCKGDGVQGARALVEKRGFLVGPSVVDEDQTNLPPLQGYLYKENRHGRWQSRYFVLNNCYLTYYRKKRRALHHDAKVSGLIDLRKACHICVLARNGVAGRKFAIQTTMKGSAAETQLQDECYFMRAASPQEAANWVDALNERRSLFLKDRGSDTLVAKQVQVRHSLSMTSDSSKSDSGSSGELVGNDIVQRRSTEDWWDDDDDDENLDGFVTGDDGSGSESDTSATDVRRTKSDMDLKKSCVYATTASIPALGQIPEPTLNQKFWTQPNVKQLMVRSQSYLNGGKKSAATTPMFQLVSVDTFITKGREDHIVGRKDNRIQQALARGDEVPFMFILNLQIPGPPFYSIVMYFAASKQMTEVLFGQCTALKPAGANRTNEAATATPTSNSTLDADRPPLPSGFTSLARSFFLDPEADDLRNHRFKLVPRIVEGPFLVRKGVGSKPALIGTKLTQRYSLHPNYLEVDIDIGSSVIAWKLTQMSIGYSKLISIDLAVVLEGTKEEELPEQVLSIVRFNQPNFSKSPALP